MSQNKHMKPDVIVVGGGLAGVAAATAAAKAGAAVLLVERQPFAGGVSTASMEPCLCNFFHNTRQELVVRGRPLELVERMVKLGAAHKNWDKHRGHIVFDVELGKVAMDDMLEEAGVEILYDTLVTGAIMEGNKVTGLRIANRSGEQAVRAGCVVDATGDADVAHYAGAPLHVGPGQSMPHSFVFRLGNVDLDTLAKYIKDNPSEYVPTGDLGLTLDEALDFYEDTGVLYFMHFGAKKMQAIQQPVQRGEYPVEWEGFKNMDAFQMHGIRWNNTLVINTGWFMLHEPDGAAMSDYLRRGRKMAHYVAAFLKDHLPGCKKSFVCATANALGIRRTRWLKNDFVLTREIYDSAPTFPDAVGRGVHVEMGTLHLTDRTFDIPLRCLMPQNVDGLIIGSGRSTSSAPAELLRTMPVTMIVGQGAGVAAAVSVKDGVAPRRVDISHVRRELASQDVRLD
ncbi:MAG: FAD-dependent oxidoreductase [Planctomycetota bacterium]